MENATAPVGVETLIVDVLAIAAAAAWLLVFGWCSVVTSRPALRAGTVDPGPGLASAKPALRLDGVHRLSSDLATADTFAGPTALPQIPRPNQR